MAMLLIVQYIGKSRLVNDVYKGLENLYAKKTKNHNVKKTIK